MDMVNEDGDLNLDERVTTTRWSEASIKGVNQCINAFFETTNYNDEVFEYVGFKQSGTHSDELRPKPDNQATVRPGQEQWERLCKGR